jgi:hypothetical protein
MPVALVARDRHRGAAEQAAEHLLAQVQVVAELVDIGADVLGQLSAVSP